MKTYHRIDERFLARFHDEHERISIAIKVVAAERKDDERFPRLLRFVAKTEGALARHRYRVVEWREAIEKMQFDYRDLPAVQRLLHELSRLLSDVLTATKRQN